MDQFPARPGESLAQLLGPEGFAVELDGGGAITQDEARVDAVIPLRDRVHPGLPLARHVLLLGAKGRRVEGVSRRCQPGRQKCANICSWALMPASCMPTSMRSIRRSNSAITLA